VTFAPEPIRVRLRSRLDKIMTYRFDARRGKITSGDPPLSAAKPSA
jgi:hypothetical protein